jgi:chorismate synthase
MMGSEHNDPLIPGGFASNHAGGILAGISNGDDLVVRAAVKPIPSISREQQTIDQEGRPTTISVRGRHDISAIPRIVPVLQAMVRLTLADFLLRQRAVG